MKNFPVVDLVEQDKAFIDEAQKRLASTNHRGQFFNLGTIAAVLLSFFFLHNLVIIKLSLRFAAFYSRGKSL